ncbi:L-lactate permease [Pseudogulbenkiania subflava]|uniref:L-lactate permease n=1 Tax=Pseudogulbenkiania subflava DSM 22618 TaxID=1123014 RepID=A0A1Y6BF66_9NEIS|nr:L-lactate permease [Pseudogulbenkiania subflava]SMF07811.1 lactate permease [Pseudogulbenkiania subflava DSM 22618]
MWSQVYDPLGNPWLSTLCAALPVIVLLSALGIFHIKAHIAAVMGLVASLLVAIGIFGMPVDMAMSATLMGAANGLLPIGWIILNVIFLYQLTERKGQFTVLRESITSVTNDRRLQLLLIAFCFGAFFEGAGGFGTPVAVTGAMLIGLGFSPLAASGLSLIANTAPVAYGALGTPINTLAKVTGLDVMSISSMVGRQMTIFAVIVPFWLLIAFCGWRNTLRIWPAALVAGLSFAIPQLLVSNLMGPELVAVIASVCSITALVVFLKVWHPKEVFTSTFGTMGGAKVAAADAGTAKRGSHGYSGGEVLRAWLPWIILSVMVFAWGSPSVKKVLDTIFTLDIQWPGLHNLVQKMPPVVAEPHLEAAIYKLNLLSTTGTGILVAALLSGLLMGYRPGELVKVYGETFWSLRYSLVTIVAMLALGYLTRFSGVDITLGLAFSHTGMFYPFFGTLLGWLGVALTGSDTAANVLFGGLQKASAQQLGLSPVLMASANSAGGVMGKMIDAQSIVVASTATQYYGKEGVILRYVFLHSLALAGMVGLVVSAMAYLPPFTHLVLWP